jgi:putative IMPACT (imprinted ancient) family translation regulator
MEVLRQKGVTNTLCVVTRYFGGVLLGAGGLVRAYSRSASDAVEAAGIIDVKPGIELSFSIDYDLYSRLETYIRQQTQVLTCDFTEKVLMRVILPLEEEEGFTRDIFDRSLGRITPLRLRERYMTSNE